MDDPTPNPFGFVDHSAFTGFGVDLVWGLDAEGAPVHINAARRGLACRLICPACKAPLIARKGAKKAAHFSHQGKDSGCGSGRETNAHYWAKQLLVEKKQIWTPVVTAVVDGASRHESKAKWMTFSDVRSERRLDRIVPDIVLILDDRRELIVEICVTHPCGEDKIALIQSNSWPAIEINLRHLRTCQDIAVIERGLLETAPRTWLCNPRRDRAENKLRAELAAAAASRAEAARRKAAQEADRQRREALTVEADAHALLGAAASAHAAVCPISDPTLLQLIARDEGELIGISGGGEGFAVTQDEWQATVVEKFVSIGDIRSYEAETFSLERVLVYLKPLIAPAFVQPPTDKVHAWMRVHHRAFRFPHEALEDYLDALCVTGSLQSDEPGEYRLPDDVVTRIEREQRRLVEIDRREEVAHVLVDQIIADLPPEEAFLLEPQAWLDTVLPGNSASPTQIVIAGGAPYRDLIATLQALVKMVAGGEDAVDDVLGLPLAAARYRAVERLSARRSREAAERSQQLRDVAARSLGQEADIWLTTPIEDSGETPLALSSTGQAGLDLCLDKIAAIKRRREHERVAAAATTTRRDKLQAVVTKLFAHNLRELALKNQSPQLGSSPWEACTTDHGLESAIRVLTVQAQGRSRRR
ncbi:competence protein CoiA family protein [Sphingomonas sp. LB2R24]|uniref:competence protein CoiA family protein n=1 Tax=Sphingomonas sorbitolis TaxID=3096165 RepID=UPI002FCC495B